MGLSVSRKVTVTLPADIVSDLDFISARLKISRSALIAALLTQSVPLLRPVADLLSGAPEVMDDEEFRRFRGESALVVMERLKGILGGLGDD